MVKYSFEPEDQTKLCKARGNNLRTHFKNMRETAASIKNRSLSGAKEYLQAVLDRKQAIAFKRFTGGRGRHAQAKNLNAPGSQVGWPVKSVKYLMDLLVNAEANAEFKGLDIDNCYIHHIQVNQAIKQRRRTYRAHGRIGPYMASPCHVELIVAEKGSIVKKAKELKKPTKLTRKQAARKRQAGVKVGGGLE